ncbi:hypothetical protein D3C85_934990 [compost metagenome]
MVPSRARSAPGALAASASAMRSVTRSAMRGAVLGGVPGGTLGGLVLGDGAPVGAAPAVEGVAPSTAPSPVGSGARSPGRKPPGLNVAGSGATCGPKPSLLATHARGRAVASYPARPMAGASCPAAPSAPPINAPCTGVSGVVAAPNSASVPATTPVPSKPAGAAAAAPKPMAACGTPCATALVTGLARLSASDLARPCWFSSCQYGLSLSNDAAPVNTFSVPCATAWPAPSSVPWPC